MRESTVEAALRDEVRRRGGLCFKITPTYAGAPDRVVLLPGAPAALVELKAPGRQPRPTQRAVHEALRRMGHEVRVIDTPAAARALVAGMLAP